MRRKELERIIDTNIDNKVYSISKYVDKLHSEIEEKTSKYVVVRGSQKLSPFGTIRRVSHSEIIDMIIDHLGIEVEYVKGHVSDGKVVVKGTKK